MDFTGMKIMRKRNLVSIFLVIALGIAAYALFGGTYRFAAQAESDKSDRLFEDMGIFRIPDSTEPVDFELPSLTAKTVRLSDFRGKIVFLNFWATWCTPCRIEMPSMEKLYSQFKNHEFAMLAVSLKESKQEVGDFFKENQLTFTGLLDLDGEVAKEFLVASIPTTFIVDRRGGILGIAMGPRPWDTKESIKLFKHLIEMESSVD
jgi:peroxiredoxin